MEQRILTLDEVKSFENLRKDGLLDAISEGRPERILIKGEASRLSPASIPGSWRSPTGLIRKEEERDYEARLYTDELHSHGRIVLPEREIKTHFCIIDADDVEYGLPWTRVRLEVDGKFAVDVRRDYLSVSGLRFTYFMLPPELLGLPQECGQIETVYVGVPQDFIGELGRDVFRVAEDFYAPADGGLYRLERSGNVRYFVFVDGDELAERLGKLRAEPGA